MSDPRPWIALLSVVCLMAGVAAGVLIERSAHTEVDRGPFAAYSDLLVDEFDLGRERAGHLRVILREYNNALEDAKKRRRADFYASLRQDVVPIGLKFNADIRDLVLHTPAQRERFDAMSNGSSLAP